MKPSNRAFSYTLLGRPLTHDNDLWAHLIRHRRRRMIVIVSADDLRAMDIEISRELSWDRTASDMLRALSQPALKDLAGCAAVVVYFGTAGSMIHFGPETSGSEAGRFALLFDPKGIEDADDAKAIRDLPGSTTCLSAGLSHGLALAGGSPAEMIEQGVRRGLVAMRALKDHGFRDRKTELILNDSAQSVDELPKSATDLTLIARLAGGLYFRIFGFDGKVVAEVSEEDLRGQEEPIAALKKELEDLWTRREVPGSRKVRALAEVNRIIDLSSAQRVGTALVDRQPSIDRQSRTCYSRDRHRPIP